MEFSALAKAFSASSEVCRCILKSDFLKARDLTPRCSSAPGHAHNDRAVVSAETYTLNTAQTRGARFSSLTCHTPLVWVHDLAPNIQYSAPLPFLPNRP